MSELLPGYRLRTGSRLDKALLVKFIQQTYEELYPGGNYDHLGLTVEQFFSKDTPLWWVNDPVAIQPTKSLFRHRDVRLPIACLWLGNAIDQISGERHAHIFLLYVAPAHRRQGIGTALVEYAEAWARARGDRQIGLQVFQSNQPALNLYRSLGFASQSLWMVKALENGNDGMKD